MIRIWLLKYGNTILLGEYGLGWTNATNYDPGKKWNFKKSS